MHRTCSVPRRACWSLLAGLALFAAAQSAAAQEALPPPQPVGGVEVAIGSTRRVEMSKKQIIREVRNENPKVARVSSLPDDPRAVLVTGLAAGTTRLTFVDSEKRTELLDVRIPDEADAQTERLRAKALALIRQAVPTAVVDVLPSGPNTVIVMGTVSATADVQPILEIVRGSFGGPTASVVNYLRVGGVQQVSLEVVVALVNRSELRQMAFSWVLNTDSFFLNSILQSPLNPANTLATTSLAAATSLTGTPNLNFGITGDHASFTGFMQALRTEGLAKILSEPRLTTLSGRPAFIVSGGETPILMSGGVGVPSVSFKQFGTVVNFLPIVLGNGKIHLEVRPELSARNDANGISIPGVTPTVIPGFVTRSAQVAVQMEDGQTLAIGGLIQSSVNAQIVKVPFLGDLPFLGAAFRNESYREEEEELLILVTPRLVDPMACTQLPKFLPGRETRSPDDFELFLEGIIEAPRGPRPVSLHPRMYQGAHMNGPTAGLYPCAGGNCASGNCAAPGHTALPGMTYPVLNLRGGPVGPATPVTSVGGSGAVVPPAQTIPPPHGIPPQQQTLPPARKGPVAPAGASLTPLPLRELTLENGNSPTGLTVPPVGDIRPALPPAPFGGAGRE